MGENKTLRIKPKGWARTKLELEIERERGRRKWREKTAGEIRKREGEKEGREKERKIESCHSAISEAATSRDFRMT